MIMMMMMMMIMMIMMMMIKMMKETYNRKSEVLILGDPNYD